MVTKNSASFIFVGQAKEPTRFYRRRLQDARIWNRIRAQGYEDVAANLCYGFAYLCWGGRAITSSWCERVSTSFNPNPENLSEGRIEYLQHCRKDYLAWADECQKHGIKHRAAMDILFFGKGTKEVEQIYGRRHGWAMSNLLQSFEFYRK